MNIKTNLIIDDFTKDVTPCQTIQKVDLNTNMLYADFMKAYGTDADMLVNGDLVKPSSSSDKSLADLSIENGCTIKIIIKMTPKKKESPAELTESQKKRMIRNIIAVHRRLLRSQSLDNLEKIICEGNLIEISEELDKDIIARSVVSNMNLIKMIIASKKNVKGVLERCPVLIDVTKKCLDNLSEICGNKLRANHISTPRFYFNVNSLDQLYRNPSVRRHNSDDNSDYDDYDDDGDDDDDGEEMETTPALSLTPVSSSTRSYNRPVITREQFHRALVGQSTSTQRGADRNGAREQASISGSLQLDSSAGATVSSSDQHSDEASNKARNSKAKKLSLSQVQSAVRNAIASSSQPVPMDTTEPTESTIPDMDSKMNTIMSMGFTNVPMIRKALEIAGGRVELAIEFLMNA